LAFSAAISMLKFSGLSRGGEVTESKRNGFNIAATHPSNATKKNLNTTAKHQNKKSLLGCGAWRSV
jgi:hypothetical protein